MEPLALEGIDIGIEKCGKQWLGDYRPHSERRIEDFVSKSTEVRSRRVCGCGSQLGKVCVWEVIKSTLVLMIRIESLTLDFGNEPGLLCIQSLCEILTPLPQLKNLKLGGSWRHSGFPKVCYF